jgi:hypothetical protein
MPRCRPTFLACKWGQGQVRGRRRPRNGNRASNRMPDGLGVLSPGTFPTSLTPSDEGVPAFCSTRHRAVCGARPPTVKTCPAAVRVKNSYLQGLLNRLRSCRSAKMAIVADRLFHARRRGFLCHPRESNCCPQPFACSFASKEHY